MSTKRYYARILRLGVVSQMYRGGELTVEEAVEILQGCLRPGDESTRIDDSALLDENTEKAFEVIKESEENQMNKWKNTKRSLSLFRHIKRMLN